MNFHQVNCTSQTNGMARANPLEIEAGTASRRLNSLGLVENQTHSDRPQALLSIPDSSISHFVILLGKRPPTSYSTPQRHALLRALSWSTEGNPRR